MTFTSNAEWPKGTMHCGNDITTDTHGSMEQAEGVVNLLYRNGFGGDRKIFPIRAWAEQIDETANIIDTRSLPRTSVPTRWAQLCNMQKTWTRRTPYRGAQALG